MSKLLCERERANPGWGEPTYQRHKAKDLQLVEYEDEDGEGVESAAPKRVPIVGRRGRGSKYLNENLSPLYKFIDSKIGKYWNKVYSEIREDLDTNSAVHMHIMQHLWQYVTRHVEVRDGKVYALPQGDGFWGRGERELNDGDIYVHPKSGVLCRYKRRKVPRKKAPITSMKLGKKSYLCKFENGIWYQCDFTVAPNSQDFKQGLIHPEHHTPRERLWGRNGGWRPNPAYGIPLRFKKSQLSSKQLRKHGLQNDR